MWPLGLKILLGEVEAPSPASPPLGETRPTASDWLLVNALTPDQSLAVLREVEVPETRAAPSAALGLSPDTAWALCADALRAAFPGLQPEIATVEWETPRCLSATRAKHAKAFTYDLGVGCPPFVSLRYRDHPSDLLAMAHEFGHALQIVASWRGDAGQMPPVARECCAFLAEQALLRHARGTLSGLTEAHRADDGIYLGRHKAALIAALGQPLCPYAYDWNYPLARIFAARMCRHPDTDGLYRAGAAGGHWLQRSTAASQTGSRELTVGSWRRHSAGTVG